MSGALYSGHVPRARVLDPCHQHYVRARSICLTKRKRFCSSLVSYYKRATNFAGRIFLANRCSPCSAVCINSYLQDERNVKHRNPAIRGIFAHENLFSMFLCVIADVLSNSIKSRSEQMACSNDKTLKPLQGGESGATTISKPFAKPFR